MLSKLSLLFFAVIIAFNILRPAGHEIKQTSPNSPGGSTNPFKEISDIPLPAGYKRSSCAAGSFGEWLRKVDLKKNKTVFRFDGTPKPYQHAQYAVLDISVGKENLQQCADAVIRLQAEYLYSAHKFDEIIFRDFNNTSYTFKQPYTRQNFDRYLRKVFGMCGSASLAKQLGKGVALNSIGIGDVLIRGGFPGHAVIVMDVAMNREGKKIYLLAQSYMPAQDIHVLVNPLNKKLSPWYELSDGPIIKTPEYAFSKYELKRW